MKFKQKTQEWTIQRLEDVYYQPLLELISRANHIHCQFHSRSDIQVCQLVSIKTGGCPEDCRYCSQSSYYQTSTQSQPLMKTEQVLQIAKQAKERGVTRVCLGAAWREIRDSPQFERILEMVEAITEMGLEVCCTLGLLKEHQAKRLKQAGLYAYNHNLDSSKKFYQTIVTTRTYEERLQTIEHVEQAGISVCCGAILGMGETVEDRLQFLHTLSCRPKPPESVPINRLVAVPGTPLEKQPLLSLWEMVRLIATVRIVLPRSMIRLSAGREGMSDEEHTLCFLAGANSIFFGEQLLTVKNNPVAKDEKLFELLGIRKQPAFAKETGIFPWIDSH